MPVAAFVVMAFVWGCGLIRGLPQGTKQVINDGIIEEVEIENAQGPIYIFTNEVTTVTVRKWEYRQYTFDNNTSTRTTNTLKPKKKIKPSKPTKQYKFADLDDLKPSTWGAKMAEENKKWSDTNEALVSSCPPQSWKGGIYMYGRNKEVLNLTCNCTFYEQLQPGIINNKDILLILLAVGIFGIVIWYIIYRIGKGK